MDDQRVKDLANRRAARAPQADADLGDLFRRIAARRRKRRSVQAGAVVFVVILALLPPVREAASNATTAALGSLTGAGHGTAPSPAFTPTPGAGPGWMRYTEPTYQATVDAPSDWTFLSDPTPTVTDPRILFVTGSFSNVSADACNWLPALPSDGAAVWMMEWFDVIGLGGTPGEFPAKPASPVLPSAESFNYDCGHPGGRLVYRIPFQTNGRFFWGLVALGSSVSADLQADCERVLDSFSASPIDVGGAIK